MVRIIRAHFDGKVFVPDEPVDAPINQPLRLQFENGAPNENGLPVGETQPDSATIAARLQRMRAAAGCISASPLSSQQVSRDVIYDDRLP